jgi:hypothetical protein
MATEKYMPDNKQPSSSRFADLLATTQGKIVSALVIIGMVIGLISEVIYMTKGYCEMVSTRADAEAKTQIPFASSGSKPKTHESHLTQEELNYLMCKVRKQQGGGNGEDCQALKPKN